MMPGQFTLKRAMLSTALIAVECLRMRMLLPGRLVVKPFPLQSLAALLAWASSAIIGGAIGLLFNHWQEGAELGVFVAYFVLFAM